jgi:hypothetical protein
MSLRKIAAALSAFALQPDISIVGTAVIKEIGRLTN